MLADGAPLMKIYLLLHKVSISDWLVQVQLHSYKHYRQEFKSLDHFKLQIRHMMFVSMRQMETKSFQREVTEVLNFGTPKTRVKPLSHNSKVIKVKFLAVNGTISTSA